MNKSEKFYFNRKLNTLSQVIENIQNQMYKTKGMYLYSEIAWLENFAKEIKELIK